MRGPGRTVACLAALAALGASGAGPAQAGELNISQFVFRDLNRNGVYDVGESPYAGIPVRLSKTGAEDIVRESNLSGFANFTMDADAAEDGDITAAGPLSFRPEPPDGLSLTTPAIRYDTVAHALEGAPAGIVIDPPLPFAGVAPDLVIDAASSLTCRPAAGEVRPVSPALRCAVTPGEWTVSAEGWSRTVAVGAWPVRVAAPFGEPRPGPTTVVGFEDIIDSQNIQEVPTGTGGLSWHNWVAVHRKYYGGWGYVNGTAGGRFAAYNSSGHPARMFSDRPFDLVGLLVSVAWPEGMDGAVRIEALRDGAVVAEDSFLASNLTPIWFAPDWSGIDEIRIGHARYWQIVIDDVTIRR